MSQETMEWLNQQTLIGYTDKRGTAWHYRAEDQGAEPNHYPGAIPIADVERRLFNWEPVLGKVRVRALLDGKTVDLTDKERKAIIHPATRVVLGIFKTGYQPHSYRRWLLENLADILDSDELGIGSAGLLRQGGQAWVSVEVPDNIVTPEGVEFRPNLVAATSLDGTLATTYGRIITNIVCDNTMATGLSEQGQKFKVRHSRYSTLRLADAREALEIIHKTGDAFAEEVASLCSVKVSEGDWNRFLDSLVPVPDEKGHARTISVTKRDALANLWVADGRVAPWRGTAWGVVQAVSTYQHHLGTIRTKRAMTEDAARAERNMSRALNGEAERVDHDTIRRLRGVLA